MATVETGIVSTRALMIDIETLSLRPDAHVTQIGYVLADTISGEVLLPARNLWVAVDQGVRDINLGTVRWWLKQDSKVIRSVLAPTDPRVTPDEAFDILKGVVDASPGVTVWGSPAMFDLPILTSLWGGRKPWKYNFERDMMTLYKLLDPAGQLQPPHNDMGHDAASDALWQMNYLVRLLGELRAHIPTGM